MSNKTSREQEERDEYRFKERKGWFRGARIETKAEREARRRYQERKGRR